MQSIVLPQETSALFMHKQYKFCYPKPERCLEKPSGLLFPCGETWNENLLCDTDSMYMMCLPKGGTIDIQTRFYDTISTTSSECPNATYEDLITVEICEVGSMLDPTPVRVQDISDFAINCFDGTSNYQVIRINVDKLAEMNINCFSLKFTGAFDESLCCESQTFRILSGDCDDSNKLVSLESISGDTDCAGNYMGDPVCCDGETQRYSNRLYVKANCKPYGGEMEPTYRGDKKVSSKVIKRERLYFTELIPPYLSDFLLCSIFSGQELIKDGELWNVEDISLNPQEGNNMTLPTIEIYRECNRSFNC